MVTGDIEIRDQPVSVGCVNEDNFVGFIDEVREICVLLLGPIYFFLFI